MENLIIQKDLEDIVNKNLPWEKFKNKTVIVSGAAGFLASYIVKTLCYLNLKRNLKIKILGLVRNEKKAREKFRDYLSDKYYRLLVQDVNKPFDIREGIDFIIHAASYASPKHFAVDPAGTMLPNIMGTYNLLELARRNKLKRFLFVSSAEVYGEGKENAFKETDYGSIDPTDIRSCYGESKRMGENMCVSWMKQYSIPINIVRFFHTYGPGMDLTDGRVQTDFVSNVVSGRDIIIKSDGRAKRAFCYITDAIFGIFAVLLKGQIGECYNIGNEEAEISMLGLAKVLEGMYPEKNLEIKYEKRKTGDKYLRSKYQRVRPNTEKIRKLGWKPEYPLKKGFKRMIESYL